MATAGAERPWRWLAALAGAPLALAAAAIVAPRIAAPAALASYLLAFACVTAEVLAASALAPPLRARALAWLLAPLGALALVLAAGEALGAIASAAIVTSALLAAGTIVGGVVGRAIERPGHLLVVAVLSALVDAFSVLHPSGPSAQIVRIEAAVSVLALPWPVLGAGAIEPILGVGDVTFAALYLAAARRHGLSVPRTLAALACGLAITLAVVIAAERGVPALPFLGAAVVIAHPEARRLPREDRRSALIGIGAVAVLFAVLFLLR